MGKEKLLPLLALLVLLLGSVSSVYVYATTTTSTSLTINGTRYTLDQIFYIGKQTTIKVDDTVFVGVALDDLMQKSGVLSPQNHEYVIIGVDGYQKTVKWENMMHGVLTNEGQTVFSDLPKAFRVKDVVSIEVR
ncbi:MAG: hypothetical protein V1726_01155 [Methanobacteriota archaeon]